MIELLRAANEELSAVKGRIAELEAENARFREALKTIAAWPFDIMGDCVADARNLALSALASCTGVAQEKGDAVEAPPSIPACPRCS